MRCAFQSMYFHAVSTQTIVQGNVHFNGPRAGLNFNGQQLRVFAVLCDSLTACSRLQTGLVEATRSKTTCC